MTAAALALISACAPSRGGALPSPLEVPSRLVLTVRTDGPRWLGPAWWRSLGLDVAKIEHESVTLSHAGVPVPLFWVDSPDGPGVLFYGQTAPSTIGQAATYVLAMDGDGIVETWDSVPLGDDVDCQTATSATLWLEQDLAYRSTAPLDVPWLWQSLRPPERLEIPVSLPDVVADEPISLTIRAWGQSALPQDPDHHLRVIWNGEAVADHFWDGSELETWSLLLPGTAIVDNVLVIATPGGTDAPVEVTWIDALEVTWRRGLMLGAWGLWRAESDGAACMQGDGTGSKAMALLVDAEGMTSRGEAVSDVGSGTVRVAQRDGDVGWIGIPWMAPAPDSVRQEEVLPEGALEAASYIVVAPTLFHDALSGLVAARASEGYTVHVVSPEAVYDTYGRGLPEALAIQSMVRVLAETGSVRYLLLVGDATPDIAAAWESAVVPTGWARTAHVGHTASDYALATGGGDEPLVAVGRLPVSSVGELQRLVDKTLTWQPTSRLLLVGDDEAEFSTMIQRLGEGQDVDRLLDSGADDVRAELLRWLGGGPGTLVYSGHGSLQLLGDEKLLTVEDGQNWQQPTVVATWSCLCAAFAHPTHQSLGEALVLAPRGVVAFVGPTGETTTFDQTAMAVAFQRALAEGEPVGDALLRGWRASTSEDTRHGFLLLGDPALRPMPAPVGEGEVND